MLNVKAISISRVYSLNNTLVSQPNQKNSPVYLNQPAKDGVSFGGTNKYRQGILETAKGLKGLLEAAKTKGDNEIIDRLSAMIEKCRVLAKKNYHEDEFEGSRLVKRVFKTADDKVTKEVKYGKNGKRMTVFEYTSKGTLITDYKDDGETVKHIIKLNKDGSSERLYYNDDGTRIIVRSKTGSLFYPTEQINLRSDGTQSSIINFALNQKMSYEKTFLEDGKTVSSLQKYTINIERLEKELIQGEWFRPDRSKRADFKRRPDGLIQIRIFGEDGKLLKEELLNESTRKDLISLHEPNGEIIRGVGTRNINGEPIDATFFWEDGVTTRFVKKYGVDGKRSETHFHTKEGVLDCIVKHPDGDPKKGTKYAPDGETVLGEYNE